MRITAWLLFIFGSITALVSAARLPTGDNNWPDTLIIFIPALGVVTVGIVLLLRTAMKRTDSPEAVKYEAAAITDLLTRIQQSIAHIEATLATTGREDNIENIHRLRNEYLLPFRRPEMQTAIQQAFGKRRGNLILDMLARGERLVYRLNTAFGDGWPDEALDACREAHVAFSEALHLANKQ